MQLSFTKLIQHHICNYLIHFVGTTSDNTRLVYKRLLSEYVQGSSIFACNCINISSFIKAIIRQQQHEKRITIQIKFRQKTICTALRFQDLRWYKHLIKTQCHTPDILRYGILWLDYSQTHGRSHICHTFRKHRNMWYHKPI